MPNISIAPLGDWLNAGWALIGAVSKVWQALSSMSDTIYIGAPGTKAGAAVTFPSDISQVPEGAVITSVTIMIRASTGSGTAPSGTAPSLTLNVAATDNPSRYTAKTIQPTATPTDYEVGTYQRDALGKAWDIFRLNFLFCRVFCYVGVADLIRVYRLWLRINYRVRPVISVNSPSGTTSSPSPDISWSYSQADGDPQKSARYKIFTAEQVAKVSFNPETAVPVYESAITGDATTVKLDTSINANSYYVYVQSVSSFGAKSTWAGRQFVVQSPSPGSPGLSDPNLPGVSSVIVVPDSEYGRASLTLRDTSNMLSVQAADSESAVDGVEMTAINATLTRDGGVSFPGTGTSSWKMTAIAAGDMTLVSDLIEVGNSLEITARAQAIAATTPRNSRVRISYFSDQFATISTDIGNSALSSNGTWTEYFETGVTPSDVVYARVYVDILGCAAGEVHNVDHLGLMYGTNTPWSDGGHMSRNLLSAWYSTAEGTPQAGESWVAGPGSQVSSLALPYGTGSSGSMANTVGYVGLSPSIGYRAAGTTFTSPTAGTGFTLNKPEGVVAGDLMLAFVTASENTEITPPTGWELAATAKVEDGATDIALFVLKRTVDPTDPTQWTDGTINANAARRTAYVVAYSGAAPASEQFIGQTQIATAFDTPLWLSTPALSNTDPNAWRVSAFATSDNASGGTLTANRNAPGSTIPISFVGASTVWGTFQGNNSGSYTLNRPSNVAAGDVMVATLSLGGVVTVTPPTGWTVRFTSTDPSGSNGLTYAVLTRVATASEPTSWSGTHSSGGVYTKVSEVLAYRGVNTTTPFLTSSASKFPSGTSFAAPTVNNTNSAAWRLTLAGVNTDNSVTLDSTEALERYSLYSNRYGTNTIATAAFDSNGPVSTGVNSAKTVSASRSYYSAYAVTVILNPIATASSAVADETPRQAASTGAANPYLMTRSFDSNTVVATGSQSITGILATSSGSDKNSMAGWVGLIKPASAVTAGYAQAQMASPVDISNLDLENIEGSDQVTLCASFIGNSSGTSFLTANFYRANALISSVTQECSAFNAAFWVKSAATFPRPDGTTRISMAVSASDREIGDVIAFDRCSIAFGDDVVYRAGTSSVIHPVFGKPQIQYADDDGQGYDEWRDLPSLKVYPAGYDPLTGLSKYLDETTIPLTSRRYRSRTQTFGLNGDLFVSDWSSASTQVYFEAENWWLKDLENPDLNIKLTVKWDDLKVSTTNTATAFQPMGRKYPVVLTEGYKGDTFSLSLIPVRHDGWISLRTMLESGKTLFLQSDIDHAWFVRPIGDLATAILATNRRRQDPLRNIELQFIQVDQPS